MPELPEVEICCRQLARWAGGRPLAEVRLADAAVVRRVLSSKPSDRDPAGAEAVAALVGRPAGALSRHGKRFGWTFGDRALLCHLGMTGFWTRRRAAEPPPDQARLGLRFGDDWVWFVDGRRFGCVVPIAADAVAETLRDAYGPDALLEPLGADALAAAVSCRKPVKVALMEQQRLAGLGNIHAAEACFRAGLDPRIRADRLAPADWAALADAILTQLRETLVAEGDEDELVYVNLGGPNPFAVYGREGEPCPTCGTAIVAEELGGRSTFWCPRCQPSRIG